MRALTRAFAECICTRSPNKLDALGAQRVRQLRKKLVDKGMLFERASERILFSVAMHRDRIEDARHSANPRAAAAKEHIPQTVILAHHMFFP